MSKHLTGDIIQLMGVLLMGSGITCEILKGGNIFLLVITIGCMIFAIGTKIKGQ